jgi:hypothetical protein
VPSRSVLERRFASLGFSCFCYSTFTHSSCDPAMHCSWHLGAKDSTNALELIPSALVPTPTLPQCHNLAQQIKPSTYSYKTRSRAGFFYKLMTHGTSSQAQLVLKFGVLSISFGLWVAQFAPQCRAPTCVSMRAGHLLHRRTHKLSHSSGPPSNKPPSPCT